MDKRVICVVEDDPSVLDVICRLVRSQGYDARCYQSADRFLQEFDTRVDCVVTDLKMPGTDGAALLARVRRIDPDIPIVILTGYADVPTAVWLMEQGAVTIVEKPFEASTLLEAARKAVKQVEGRRAQREEGRVARENLARLGEDELAVLREMVAGTPNKAIASKLALSPRTVDRRRRTVFDTMGVDSIAELAALLARHNLL